MVKKNQQIVLQKGDKGHVLNVNFIDSAKSPIDITDNTVEVVITCNGVMKSRKNASIVSGTGGKARVVLDKKDTSEAGLWIAYFTAYNNNSDTVSITANDAIYYYVMNRYGGVDDVFADEEVNYLDSEKTTEIVNSALAQFIILEDDDLL